MSFTISSTASRVVASPRIASTVTKVRQCAFVFARARAFGRFANAS